MTKKSIEIMALLLCLCLTAGLLTGCGSGGIGQYEEEGAQTPPEETADAEAATDTPAPTATPDPGLGPEAYDGDTVVAAINGEPVTWQEYYYWLRYYVDYSDYLAGLGAFSYTDSWDGNDISSTLTNAEVVRTSAWENLSQYRAMEALAKELDVTLDDGGQAQIETAFETAADEMGDGDGTCSDDEADAYEDYLGEQFMTREMYDRMIGDSLLMDAAFEALYGEEGKDFPDDEAVSYGEEQELLRAKHILLMTVDKETGAALDEETAAEKKAKADELYEQLAAVKDDPEKLETLFDQLMEEYTEDNSSDFPDGYLFAADVMVPEFEDTTRGLEEYGLSEPVQSSYGWHIILRLPIDPDGTVLDTGGQQTPLRAAAASDAMMTLITETVQKAEVTWEPGFEELDVGEIFGER